VADKPSLFPSSAVFVFLGALAELVVVCLVGLAGLSCRVLAGAAVPEVVLSPGSNSPLSVTIVEAEHVAVLETALLTASASARREAMYCRVNCVLVMVDS
jgi:hypothetical protein